METTSQRPHIADPYVIVAARHGTMLANSNDIYIGQALIQYGEYCEEETKFILRWIDRPGAVVEVGANIGSQTVALARAAKAVSSEAIAIEPQPFVFQNLCANLALNGLDNVTAWPYACGRHQGSIWLAQPDYQKCGNFGGVSVCSEHTPSALKVPCTRLDDLIDGRQVRLLKVDVEGYELAVLQGATEILSNSRPILYVENDRVEQSENLIRFLWSRGYFLWWHITPLYSPHNFMGVKENRYAGLSSFNMIGLPMELRMSLRGWEEITDASVHPLSKWKK
ncbi:FkbM family methyltransferase [Paraburkholderia kururiensis]|uniref:FkbM family methyltransferase n=1 Tax=Paraburkholderia kururiensis TaxID=984307 RepID=UPI00196A805F|nr:FkbM family methyltransferase [Paraburkholderia kururiensis]